MYMHVSWLVWNARASPFEYNLMPWLLTFTAPNMAVHWKQPIFVCGLMHFWGFAFASWYEVHLSWAVGTGMASLRFMNLHMFHTWNLLSIPNLRAYHPIACLGKPTYNPSKRQSHCLHVGVTCTVEDTQVGTTYSVLIENVSFTLGVVCMFFYVAGTMGWCPNSRAVLILKVLHGEAPLYIHVHVGDYALWINDMSTVAIYCLVLQSVCLAEHCEPKPVFCT